EIYNFGYDVPENWNNDVDVRGSLQVNTFALRRDKADAWVAMYAQDYKDRDPRVGELRTHMTEKLHKHFQRVEMANQEGQYSLAKQPATVVRFEAEQDSVPIEGECHLMAYKGVGYIFFAWAAKDRYEEWKPELQKMRDRLVLLNKRENFKARLTAVAFSPPEGGYQLEDTERAWHDRRPAADPGPTD